MIIMMVGCNHGSNGFNGWRHDQYWLVVHPWLINWLVIVAGWWGAMFFSGWLVTPDLLGQITWEHVSSGKPLMKWPYFVAPFPLRNTTCLRLHRWRQDHGNLSAGDGGKLLAISLVPLAAHWRSSCRLQKLLSVPELERCVHPWEGTTDLCEITVAHRNSTYSEHINTYCCAPASAKEIPVSLPDSSSSSQTFAIGYNHHQ